MRTHAEAVRPWFGMSRSDAVAGTVMLSWPENLAPPAISEAGVNTAEDAVGLFL